MANFGFTVGICDCICEKNTLDKIKKMVLQSKVDFKELLQNVQKGELADRQPGSTIMQAFESSANMKLSKVRDDCGKEAQNALKRNNIKTMVDAGSKGSNLNISQIMACVGQQNVCGKRIPYGFVGRTIPHFTKDDLGPESKGFVSNS